MDLTPMAVFDKPQSGTCVSGNVGHKLWADTLPRFLTSYHVSVRPLSKWPDVRLRNTLNRIVTGDNVQSGGDLRRRCFWMSANTLALQHQGGTVQP